MSEIDDILNKARSSVLSEEECGKLKAVAQTLALLTLQIEKKNTSIHRLRKLLFGQPSERSEKIFTRIDGPTGPAAPSASGDAVSTDSAGSRALKSKDERKKGRGHGRNGADAYLGAERIEVPHEVLKAGGPCPEAGCRGKVYLQHKPAFIVRILGATPLQGRVYELQRLRCGDCGKMFTARAPEGVGQNKYDETAASMIGCLRYGCGFPFNRIEKLQGNAGIPLPAATQWEIVKEKAAVLAPVYQELIDQAAQGDVVHNDDTPMKILELTGDRKSRDGAIDDSSERKGVFTSGIISKRGDLKIALFFTGKKHAGENLTDVLERRRAELSAPIHMCDGLSRNDPGNCPVISSNCTAHGRRRFVDVVESFPEECRHVLEILGKVYHHDAVAYEKGMSNEERLRFHQAESGPLMDDLHGWLEKQIRDRLVEPNSGLGEAIAYMLKRWEKLTVFLRVPGAVLDNNICERGLKKAILHRKASLFYKTQNGARVGDIFMTLIHTAELAAVDPFHYLTELQRHAQQVKENPAEWMPWNYRETLKATDASGDPPSRG